MSYFFYLIDNSIPICRLLVYSLSVLILVPMSLPEELNINKGRWTEEEHKIFMQENDTACTMHSLAWDDPEEEKGVHNATRASSPGQVIDLPKPPDHIIVDINPIKGIKWPCHLNLSSNSNLIRIPIGFTS